MKPIHVITTSCEFRHIVLVFWPVTHSPSTNIKEAVSSTEDSLFYN